MLLCLRSAKISKSILTSNSFSRWIYLGKDYFYLSHLVKLLGKKRYINYSEIFNCLVSSEKKNFINAMSDLGKAHWHDDSWWATSFAARDTSCSDLYLKLIYCLVCQKFMSENSDVLVIVDHYDLFFVLEKKFNSIITNSIALRLKNYFLACRQRIKLIVKIPTKIVYGLLKNVFLQFVCRASSFSFLRRKEIPPSFGKVFMHTFTNPEFIDIEKDEFKDRYFPGFFDYLQSNNISVSTLLTFTKIPIFSFWKYCRWARSSKHNILLPYDFFKITYYFKAIIKIIKQTRLGRSAKVNYAGFDISSLIRYEKMQSLSNFSCIYWWSFSFIFKGWKKRGIDMKYFVHTYEQLFVDGLLVSGVKKYYPQCVSMGFQHCLLTPEERLASYATNAAELACRPLPNILLVPNEATYNQNINNGLVIDKIVIAPALRYQYLLSQKKVSGSKNKKIVVLCHLIMESVVSLLSKILEIEGSLKGDFEIVVKLHPIMPYDQINSLFSIDLKDKFTFSDDSIHEVLSQAALVIYSNTTAAVDAYLLGLHVFQVAEEGVMNYSPLSAVSDSEYIHYVNDINDIPNKIKGLDFSSNPKVNLNDYINNDFSVFNELIVI